ncbi:hypothetical protein [Streptomyces canus]|uniref:hypothetical protein n=1 Tax=Streptomyces canus TaxID=58343 RepID=UPI0030DF1F4B
MIRRLSAYTPDARRRMFEVLVERSEERGWVDLTRILPRLKIAERCSLDGRHLVVPCR